MDSKTPLELARERQGQPKRGTCLNCAKLVKLDGVFYCEESGKMLLSVFLDSYRPCYVCLTDSESTQSGGDK